MSRVERDGAAWAAGLRPGDLLLGAGQAAFSALTHKQVIQVSVWPGEVISANRTTGIYLSLFSCFLVAIY